MGLSSLTETLLFGAYLYLCKCTVLQALSFYTIRLVHRWGRSTALFRLDRSCRRGWVVSSTSGPLYALESLGTHCREG